VRAEHGAQLAAPHLAPREVGGEPLGQSSGELTRSVGVGEVRDAQLDRPVGRRLDDQVLEPAEGPRGRTHPVEVHDPAQYYFGQRQFSPGDVFTVEPGLYVSPDLLGALPDTPKNRTMRAKTLLLSTIMVT